MKVVTAAQMREIDRATIELGIPGIVLMESAGASLLRVLKQEFSPLRGHRVLIVCGKGNNGGDGFVLARLLRQHKICGALQVVEAFGKETLTGDAALARKMLVASGCEPRPSIAPLEEFSPTLIVDAILGTGVKGAASGRALELIEAVNKLGQNAVVIAVDIPSGFPSDETEPAGPYVHAAHTVTFTALKHSQAFSPSYKVMGKLHVHSVGTPDSLCETNDAVPLRLTTPADIAPLFQPRRKDSNKGLYGHVMVVGGSVGKAGAPAMAGLSALRSGAGLVTVASASDAISTIAAVSPALMTELLPQSKDGRLNGEAKAPLDELLKKMTVLALGPGLGTAEATVKLVRDLYREAELPMVLDADGLNAVAGTDLSTDQVRILTPHPGEMARLTGKSVKEVQAARLTVAQGFARVSRVAVVLKGDRTVIAFPDGETWINPTGSPSMATGGTGDE